jgi:hypothetical protein
MPSLAYFRRFALECHLHFIREMGTKRIPWLAIEVFEGERIVCRRVFDSRGRLERPPDWRRAPPRREIFREFNARLALSSPDDFGPESTPFSAGVVLGSIIDPMGEQCGIQVGLLPDARSDAPAPVDSTNSSADPTAISVLSFRRTERSEDEKNYFDTAEYIYHGDFSDDPDIDLTCGF